MLNMILNRGKWTCCLWQLHSSSAFHLKKLTKGGTSAPSVSSLSSLWWWLVSTSVDQCPVSSKPSPVHTFLLKQMHHLHRLISLDLVNNWGFSSASSFLGHVVFPPPLPVKRWILAFSLLHEKSSVQCATHCKPSQKPSGLTQWNPWISHTNGYYYGVFLCMGVFLSVPHCFCSAAVVASGGCLWLALELAKLICSALSTAEGQSGTVAERWLMKHVPEARICSSRQLLCFERLIPVFAFACSDLTTPCAVPTLCVSVCVCLTLCVCVCVCVWVCLCALNEKPGSIDSLAWSLFPSAADRFA